MHCYIQKLHKRSGSAWPCRHKYSTTLVFVNAYIELWYLGLTTAVWPVWCGLVCLSASRPEGTITCYITNCLPVDKPIILKTWIFSSTTVKASNFTDLHTPGLFLLTNYISLLGTWISRSCSVCCILHTDCINLGPPWPWSNCHTINPTSVGAKPIPVSSPNTYLLKWDLRHVSDVTALSFEQCVRLVPDNEHNISRNLVAALVSFPLKRYFCACLPTWFHIDCQHFVLFLWRSIWLKDTSWYLHFLCTTATDVLQCYIQIMLNGWILKFILIATGRSCVEVERMRPECPARSSGSCITHS